MVANVPDYCMEEVSDHAMAMRLALWRGVTSTIGPSAEEPGTPRRRRR